MSRRKIAGIILAGGRSSRMGENKALIKFQGKTLLDHMLETLNSANMTDVFISGTFDGYNCIPDTKNFQGPAIAIKNILLELVDYDGVFFTPVDMPLLSVDAINFLLENKNGAFYKYHPFPVYIPNQHNIDSDANSVKALLNDLSIKPQKMPKIYQSEMTNLNTPDDWQKIKQG